MAGAFKTSDAIIDLKLVMMAMLSTALLSYIWGEVSTARLELKPALSPYTILCNNHAKQRFKFLESLCKDEHRSDVASQPVP